MTPNPKLVEAVARAAYADTNVFWAEAYPDKSPLETWEETTDTVRRHWLVFAEAALAVIAASGEWWIAPVEVSDAMYEAGTLVCGRSCHLGGQANTIYAAMRDAHLKDTGTGS